jgi:purine-nucleoside phosphorylase
MAEKRPPNFMKLSISKEAGPKDPFSDDEKSAAAKAAAAGGVLGAIAGAVVGGVAGAAAGAAAAGGGAGAGAAAPALLDALKKGTLERADEAALEIRSRLGIAGAVPIAIVLGSGLGAFGESLEGVKFLPYGEVPHLPRSTVQGHKGRFAYGAVAGTPVLAMQGRFHFYEGYGLDDVTFPIRVFGRLGARVIVLTNAAGGLGDGLQAGDLMMLTDHLNLIGQNPLRGHNDERLGPRFPDMTEVYPRRLREAFRAAAPARTPLREGVYAALAGPSYETPAEIRMLRTLGADAVGMSTAPEAIVASHMKIPVLGVSGIANMAAGIVRGHTLTHQEVVDTMDRIGEMFSAAIRAAVPALVNAAGSPL